MGEESLQFFNTTALPTGSRFALGGAPLGFGARALRRRLQREINQVFNKVLLKIIWNFRGLP